MILGLHIRATKNAGDRAASPLDYFDFGAGALAADMREPPRCAPELVVYGGGSIVAAPGFHAWHCPVVAWGVGHHVRHWPWAGEMARTHREAAAKCALYFPRDADCGFARVPCASCMHPVFDEAFAAPEHDEVRYSAARRVDVDDGVAPHMTNEDGTIEEAVRFLTRGRRVVTSSYHGAYWAGLLGREVQVVPWGSKFDYLPELTLEECRAANRAAHALVRGLS